MRLENAVVDSALKEKLAILKVAQTQLDIAFANGLRSREDYYETTYRLEEEALLEEINALEQKKKIAEKYKETDDALKYGTEIKLKQIQLAELSIKANEKLSKSYEELRKNLNGVYSEYLKYDGQLEKATEIEIENKFKDQKTVINTGISTLSSSGTLTEQQKQELQLYKDAKLAIEALEASMRAKAVIEGATAPVACSAISFINWSALAGSFRASFIWASIISLISPFSSFTIKGFSF